MASMPDKRKPSGSFSGSSPYAKRSRPSYAEEDDEEETSQPTVTPYERPRNHPVYGQKSAFPGLDVAGEDELFYGPAEDGMEYLRMVRSEANSLPFLFTAPQTTEPPTETDNKDKEPQPQPQEEEKPAQPVPEGVVVDGVFFIPPSSNTKTTATAPRADVVEKGISDAQSSYYNLLHHRFLLLRSILKCSPPPEAIAALDDSHLISLPRHARNARKEWRRLLLAVDPQTVQLACMDMESVLAVLGIMARLMSENVRSGDAQRVRRIGAWAWGLLGRCRDVGQLGTEEVGEIRELGKRAVKILRKMREEDEKKMREEGDASDEEDDEEDTMEQGAEGDGVVNQVDGPSGDQDHEMQDVAEEPAAEDLEAAKARLQAKIQGVEEQPPVIESGPGNEENATEVAVQTRAMLDMIITVIGEYYGQRDLLEARELWNGPEESTA